MREPPHGRDLPQITPVKFDSWQALQLCGRALVSTMRELHNQPELSMLRPLSRPAPITTPAWIVCAWPPVTCPLQQAPKLNFVHLGTRVLKPGDADSPTTGQTLWGGPSGSGAAGVAWDWVEIQEGVVAMADPFGLVTNLQFVGTRGQVLTGFEATLQLNELVHALPWQTEVQRALERVEH